jgi:FlaA1/EpsC-like NDP-sugar epimerase
MNILQNFSKWCFSKSALPYWCILAYDSIVVVASGYFVYYLQHGLSGLVENLSRASFGIGICFAIYMFAFMLFHTFNGVLRFSSFIDLRRVAYSTFTASFLVCVFHQIQVYCGLTPYMCTPRFFSGVQIFITATMFMWALRIMVKILHDNYSKGDNALNAFIYGCMQGGVALAKSVRSQSPSRYRISGFISAERNMTSSLLMGEKIYYDDDNIVETMKNNNVKVLLVSPLQTERFTHRTSLINALIAANIKVMMMPSAEEWDGKSSLSHTQLHEVDIEDLLPRDKIEVDMNAIKDMLTGRRILITGAAGSIGSEMARQVATFKPAELVLVDQAETPMHDVRLFMSRNHSDLNVWTIVGSITNKSHMEDIFSAHKPEFVFHAAAYKHVPMMEDNPAMAIQNNVYGTRVIADLAVKYGTKKFVMISTDKAVNPTNVMGCSKRICEIYCQSLNKAIQDGEVKGMTQFVTTRFGNVLGSNGSVIPLFKEQIRKGGPVTVTHKDIIRFFMLIPEACRLVLEAGTMGKGGEIFVFDMGEPVRIADLAQRMINLSGAKNIEIKFTGLRDGEKLYEEVLNDAEQTKPTVHPKIKVAAVREYPYELALQNEKDLYDISLHYDDMAIVKKMKQIVPEYKSRHSKYEKLDN